MCWKEGSETVFTLTLDCNKYIIIIVFLSKKAWWHKEDYFEMLL
ncbi:hypothetical protein EV208_10230 [Christensenella hongkongensis]|nr:hypothetical protein EV208_10230 [Christensenella hongkongensis]